VSVKQLRYFPDSFLKHPCQLVPNFNESAQALFQDLEDTLKKSPGVALAAPQIGVHQRAFVVDIGKCGTSAKRLVVSDHGLIKLANPEILLASEEINFREGCLSVPDFLADVKRFLKVKVHGFLPDGKEVEIFSEGLEAIAIQHEVDHLNGLLFLDRVSNIKTDLFRRKNN
jgi:peptide deformylase